MSEWHNYRPSDFLLFSTETYWRLFELQNQCVWPLQIVVVAAAIALTAAVFGNRRWSGLAAGLGLAVVWVFVGESFLAIRYEPINWAIGYLTPFFRVQAALLAIFGSRLVFGRVGIGPGLSSVLVILALGYPAVALLVDRPLVQSEVVGIAPDPTVVFTLAILGLARRGWRVLVLSIIPAIWLLFSATTLLTLGAPEGWIILTAFGAGLFALAFQRFQTAADSGSQRS